jgi:hypothetical protein
MVCRMISLYLQVDVVRSNCYTCVPGFTIQWFQIAKSSIIVACCNTLLIFCHWIFCTNTAQHYVVYITCQIWIQMIGEQRKHKILRFYFDRFPTARKISILLSFNLFFVSSCGWGHFCGWQVSILQHEVFIDASVWS